jgi:hypothetical protein
MCFGDKLRKLEGTVNTSTSSHASGRSMFFPLFAGVVLACGGAEPAPMDEPESLQAVLSIERMENANGADAASASAMAEFVVLPADADAHQTLDAAGLRMQLPERRGCSETPLGPSFAAARERERSSAFAEQLELLEAGEVTIEAGEMVTRLALNLFPPSGSASGVIYTTPDRSAALPPGLSYAIVATGSEAIPPLSIQQEAPSSLRDVTIGGVPFDRATALAAGQPLDITWAEGERSDRVFVELDGSEASVLCTFADDDGSGTVPAGLTAKLGSDAVRVALHRVRETVGALEPPRPDALIIETMVRFDFELTSTLRLEQ